MNIRDVIHFYLDCECIVDFKRYTSGVGKKYNMQEVPGILDSINRNRDIDQCWGITVRDEQGFEFYDVFDRLNRYWEHFVKLDDFKLLLRPITDLTDEEKTEISKRVGWWDGKVIVSEHHLNVAHDTMKEMAYDAVVTANDDDAHRLGPTAYFELVPYLCRQRIDIFGLIKSGQALDATKYKAI